MGNDVQRLAGTKHSKAFVPGMAGGIKDDGMSTMYHLNVLKTPYDIDDDVRENVFGLALAFEYRTL